MSLVTLAHSNAVVRSPRSSFRSVGWLLLSLALLLLYAMMVRACGNDHRAVLSYFTYVVFYVWLPGWTVLRLATRRPVGGAEAIALALPLGYGIEISVFLMLSAFGLREMFVAVPAASIAAGGWLIWRDASSLRVAFHKWNPWIALALAGVMLGMTATAANQLFIQAPMADGLVSTMTHHDWIYLISRAAEIKQHWPLEDPSMAGASLSYHYFLMVHVAAAASITGNEVSLLLLRCFVFPVGAALAMQGFMLGRLLTRSAWGGVLAVALMMMTEEVSFTTSSQWGTFFNLFIRWLYLSPTFFFGMIFTGALVLWIWQMATGPTRPGEMVLLVLLAMAGTGAKGTVVPPLILALALWIVVETWLTRRLAWRLGWMLGALCLGFAAVYGGILADWGSGGAKLSPWVSVRLAMFWQDHADTWAAALTLLGAPRGAALWVAHVACAAIILLGSSGVRLLALPYALGWNRRCEPHLVLWLSLVWFMSQLSGNILQLDSNSQLYLLFPSRLMLSALAAAALAQYGPWLMAQTRINTTVVRASLAWLWRTGTRHSGIIVLALSLAAMMRLIQTGYIAWWAGTSGYVLALLVFTPGRSVFAGLRIPGLRSIAAATWSGGLLVWRIAPLMVVGAVLLVQINHWRLRNEDGFRLWLAADVASVAPDPDMQLLREGMHWLREHSEPNAIIVANAFTPRNVYTQNVVIDRTTADKYFYYSALSERRLWVEGPTYLRDQVEARRRMELAAKVFYGGMPPHLLPLSDAPAYVLIDRRIEDHAQAELPLVQRVFANERLQIFRVSTAPATVVPPARRLAGN